MPLFLETQRLRLRQFTNDDVDALWTLDSDPDVMRFINGGTPITRDVIREQTLPRFLASYDQQGRYGVFAAIEKTTAAFLGWFWFKPALESANIRPVTDDPHVIEIGWRLHKAAWGHGYAPEGACALLQKGFAEGDAQQVLAHTLAANTKSIRVMEKIGLRLVHTFIYEGAPGAWHVGQAAVTYGVDRDEWLRKVGVVS